MGKNRNPEAFLPYAEIMLRGGVIQPDEHHDRQALARIADGIRSVVLIPVETVRLDSGVVGYRITEAERRAYTQSRPEQESRQRKAIEHAANVRDARRARKLFARLGLELPPVVAALAKELAEDKVLDINDLGEHSEVDDKAA